MIFIMAARYEGEDGRSHDSRLLGGWSSPTPRAHDYAQVRAAESSIASTPATARLARCASAGATPRGASSLQPATPRSAAHAQDEAHRRWLEDLRSQYGHPAVTGAPRLLLTLT